AFGSKGENNELHGSYGVLTAYFGGVFVVAAIWKALRPERTTVAPPPEEGTRPQKARMPFTEYYAKYAQAHRFSQSAAMKEQQKIEFRTLSGGRAFGYSADLLPQVCGVFLDAKADGVLAHTQVHIADQALILIRGFASVGIIALVDEATGFQYDRPRRDLEEYLKQFLS